MDGIFDQLQGVQVAPLRYHMNWPASSDPMYLYNPTELQARRSYYGVNYVPTFRWDGKYQKDPSDFGTYAEWYAYVWTTIDSLYHLPSPVALSATPTLDLGANTMDVSIDLNVEDTLSGDIRLYLAITQEWARIAGSGKHYWVFRDMVPGTSGDPVTVSLPGELQHFDYSVAYDDSAYRSDRMVATIWVQKNTTRKVLQAWQGFFTDVSTGVASGEVPLRIALDQNRPNPFNPTTSIGFAVDQAGPVRLSVFAPTGRLVTTLISEPLAEGSHDVTWNGRDRFGEEVGSGVYYYRLETEKTSLTKKMILVR